MAYEHELNNSPAFTDIGDSLKLKERLCKMTTGVLVYGKTN